MFFYIVRDESITISSETKQQISWISIAMKWKKKKEKWQTKFVGNNKQERY